MRSLKYFAAFQIPVVVMLSLMGAGWWSFAAVVHVYVIIPILDQLLPQSTYNMNKVEEEAARKDTLYDWMLYLLVPFQVGMLIFYLYQVAFAPLTMVELVGNTITMGISCAGLGINLGHELGHRVNKMERMLAKTLLLTTLDMHFIIEHNLGHHKRVATAEDPASAGLGEIVYAFVPKSMVLSYLSAWEIERSRRKRRNKAFWSLNNEMIQMTLIQLAALAAVYFLLSPLAALMYIVVGLIGQALLEIINYVEHYGLSRAKKESGRYERVHPHHSWNSNHAYGRLVLFELTRHSDHHFMAERPYQVLRHFDEAPQLPAGYPAMVLLTLIPPLWFHVMNPRAKAVMQEQYTDFDASGNPLLA